MSTFPQSGPFNGPYGFRGQYAPPPPPQTLPYNAISPQGYPQTRHPAVYGSGVPQNAPMIPYANAATYNNNALYTAGPPSSALPPQHPPQPYYGYAQYNSGAPPPPFSAPASSASYNSTATPVLGQGAVQLARLAGATGLPRLNTVSGAPGLVGGVNHAHASSVVAGKDAEQIDQVLSVEVVDPPSGRSSAKPPEDEMSTGLGEADMNLDTADTDSPVQILEAALPVSLPNTLRGLVAAEQEANVFERVRSASLTTRAPPALSQTERRG